MCWKHISLVCGILVEKKKKQTVKSLNNNKIITSFSTFYSVKKSSKSALEFEKKWNTLTWFMGMIASFAN